MLTDGISVRVVQEFGGWTSLRMLERNTHPTGAEKRPHLHAKDGAESRALGGVSSGPLP